MVSTLVIQSLHCSCLLQWGKACCCSDWIMGFYTVTFSLPFHWIQDWSFSFNMYAAVWCTFQLNPAYTAKRTCVCLSASKFSEGKETQRAAQAIWSFSSKTLTCYLVSHQDFFYHPFMFYVGFFCFDGWWSMALKWQEWMKKLVTLTQIGQIVYPSLFPHFAWGWMLRSCADVVSRCGSNCELSFVLHLFKVVCTCKNTCTNICY